TAAGTEGHGDERLLGDVHGHAGLMTQALVETLEQGAATGQDDAPIHDVAGQLGRSLVEGGAYRVDDRVERLLQRLADVGRTQADRTREAADQVATAHVGAVLALAGEGRPEADLHLFRGPVAEQERVLLLEVLDDRVVQRVAGGPDAQAGDDAAERDDRDLGRAATD